MWRFLVMLLAIYGSVHAYFFWKVRVALPRSGRLRLAVAGFVVMMVAAPVLSRLLDYWGHSLLGGALAMVGFIWMPMILWFFVLFLASDLWNLAVRLVALAAPAARAALLPARPTLAAIGGIVLAALVWGLVEAQSIQTTDLTVELPDLPASGGTIKLALIADMHLGVHTGGRRLARTIELVRQAAPDILVSAGDLIDGSAHDLADYAAALRQIDPPLGKFAVLGNHEFYVGVTDSLAFHKAAGFRVLRGESVEVCDGLRIAGVDDPAGRRTRERIFTDEDAVLPGEGENVATVLLKHRPEVAPGSVGRFDLQLSGHSHGGQIFPWHLVTALQFQFARGRHDLPGGSTVYVSRGTGTWGPPVRLLSRPEVTVITLTPAPAPTTARRPVP